VEEGDASGLDVEMLALARLQRHFAAQGEDGGDLGLGSEEQAYRM
jgi:hypothetical protein